MKLSDVTHVFCRGDIAFIPNPDLDPIDPEPCEIAGYSWYVVAEAADGSRWRHFYNFDSKDKTEGLNRAERMKDRISLALCNGTPLNSVYWTRIESAYGSISYVDSWGFNN